MAATEKIPATKHIVILPKTASSYGGHRREHQRERSETGERGVPITNRGRERLGRFRQALHVDGD
jgi:hypothetical protein